MAALVGLAMLLAQTEDIEALAEQAGVGVIELQGAVNTTGLSPAAYLHMTGELVPEPAPKSPAFGIPGIWQRLAVCESSGNWHINTGNGYYGGLQEDLTFWRRYGGPAYASRPDLASPEAQILIAQRGQSVQGWGAWPRCSRLLGLR